MTTVRRQARALAAIGLAAATLAAALAAGSAPGGAQAADPQVTLEPATGLADGTRVTVTATGFAPNQFVSVLQCPAGTPGSFAGCDFDDFHSVSTDASGSATLELAVDATLARAQVGQIGDPASQIDCRPAGACVVRARSRASSRTRPPRSTSRSPSTPTHPWRRRPP